MELSKKENGFTLVELMIVIVIVAILAAVAISKTDLGRITAGTGTFTTW